MVKSTRFRLHRLGDQDAALSRLKPEFESLWRHPRRQPNNDGCFFIKNLCPPLQGMLFESLWRHPRRQPNNDGCFFIENLCPPLQGMLFESLWRHPRRQPNNDGCLFIKNLCPPFRGCYSNLCGGIQEDSRTMTAVFLLKTFVPPSGDVIRICGEASKKTAGQDGCFFY